MYEGNKKRSPKPQLSRQQWKEQQFQKVLDRQKYSKKRQDFFVLQRNILRNSVILFSLIFFLLPLLSILKWTVSMVFLGVVLFILLIAYISARMQEKQLKHMLTSADTLDKLYVLNPFDFEEAVGELFRKNGFENVRITPSQLDGGVDIIMEKNGESYGVQCKKYDPQSYIKIEIVKALIPSCQRMGLHHPVFVTTAKFSTHTREYMKGENMWLIDGNDLVVMMNRT